MHGIEVITRLQGNLPMHVANHEIKVKRGKFISIPLAVFYHRIYICKVSYVCKHKSSVSEARVKGFCAVPAITKL